MSSSTPTTRWKPRVIPRFAFHHRQLPDDAYRVTVTVATVEHEHLFVYRVHSAITVSDLRVGWRWLHASNFIDGATFLNDDAYRTFEMMGGHS